MKICNSFLSLLFCISFYSNINAASITGTIFHGDTTTPVTTNGSKIYIEAHSTQCPDSENCTGWCMADVPVGSWVDSDTGTYHIHNISAGSYFLVARANYDANYLSEWWAVPESARNCDEAQEVTISENEEKTGVDFNLDPGATVSGTIFKNDGISPLITPSSTVTVYSSTGESLYSTSTNNGNPNGDYTIVRIPTGQYYLKVTPSAPLNYNGIAYTSEWWTSNDSSESFSDAQLINITEGEYISEKYFQLDPLFKIFGTIFYDDGITPVKRGEEKVKILISETPCGDQIQNYSGHNDWSGEYLIWNIPPGNYYLKAVPYGATRFQETWWSGTGGMYNCNSAQQFEVGGENNVFNKDFRIKFLKPFPWYLIVPVLGHQ